MNNVLTLMFVFEYLSIYLSIYQFMRLFIYMCSCIDLLTTLTKFHIFRLKRPYEVPNLQIREKAQ